MFLFSVIDLLLLGLEPRKCDVLQPCLEKIVPQLETSPVQLEEDVVQYFYKLKKLQIVLEIGHYVKARQEYLQMLPKETLNNLSSNGGIFIFIDDSNLWIGSKTQACDRIIATGYDPRVRIDIGKLIKHITGNRSLLGCYIWINTSKD